MDPAHEMAAGVRDVLEQAVQGRTTGLGDLLESYRPRLERMVGFRLDHRLRGRVDVNDVLQETFAEVVDRLPGYLAKPEFDFFLWVRSQTGQKLAQFHRQHLGTEMRDVGREVPLTLQLVPGASSFALASAILDSAETPSRIAMQNEEGQRLQRAIEEMKAIDREVLTLRHFEQLSNGEVAQLLELTEPGASLRYVRALRRLRDILAELELSSDAFRA